MTDAKEKRRKWLVGLGIGVAAFGVGLIVWSFFLVSNLALRDGRSAIFDSYAGVALLAIMSLAVGAAIAAYGYASEKKEETKVRRFDHPPLDSFEKVSYQIDHMRADLTDRANQQERATRRLTSGTILLSGLAFFFVGEKLPGVVMVAGGLVILFYHHILRLLWKIGS